MSDETKRSEHDEPSDEEFEAHGLREGIAVAVSAGALAVTGTAGAYVAPVGDSARVGGAVPAKVTAKKTVKKSSAKKKSSAVSAGKTSPAKAPLQPDA